MTITMKCELHGDLPPHMIRLKPTGHGRVQRICRYCNREQNRRDHKRRRQRNIKKSREQINAEICETLNIIDIPRDQIDAKRVQLKMNRLLINFNKRK